MIKRPKRLGRRLMIRLSDRMYEGLVALAAERERDVSALIREAVEGAYFLPSDGRKSTDDGTETSSEAEAIAV